MRVYINTDKKDEVSKFGVRIKKEGRYDWELGDDEAIKPTDILYFELGDSGIFANDPPLPEGCIKKVTVFETFEDGFVKPGRYQNENAIAEVEIKKSTSSFDELEIREDVRISASSIDGARKMLDLLRKGEIQPVEVWAGHAGDFHYIVPKKWKQFTAFISCALGRGVVYADEIYFIELGKMPEKAGEREVAAWIPPTNDVEKVDAGSFPFPEIYDRLKTSALIARSN